MNCSNEELYDINNWVDVNIDTYTLIIRPQRRLINLGVLLHPSIVKSMGKLELSAIDQNSYSPTEIEIFNTTFEKYNYVSSNPFEYSMDFVIALGKDFENDI